MDTIDILANQEYKEGWVTDIEMDTAPPGLTEEIIRFISAKKN
jgi:Fe-S cluster assembly protein SufB